MPHLKRILITQRIVSCADYPESRDALSHDWLVFLSKITPGTTVLPVPNNPPAIADWFDDISPDLVVLSGGNDWGTSPSRDEMEKQLVRISRNKGIPILGVCRGLQVLNILFGGSIITDINSEQFSNHAGSTHNVTLTQEFSKLCNHSTTINVNSYHNQGLRESELAPDLHVFAESDDGLVEGLYHPNEPIIGIQWHPERTNPSDNFDTALLQMFFSSGVFWT